MSEAEQKKARRAALDMFWGAISKDESIERLTGQPVTWLSYPFTAREIKAQMYRGLPECAILDETGQPITDREIWAKDSASGGWYKTIRIDGQTYRAHTAKSGYQWASPEQPPTAEAEIHADGSFTTRVERDAPAGRRSAAESILDGLEGQLYDHLAAHFRIYGKAKDWKDSAGPFGTIPPD